MISSCFITFVVYLFVDTNKLIMVAKYGHFLWKKSYVLLFLWCSLSDFNHLGIRMIN
jgi:hypothetical protein